MKGKYAKLSSLGGVLILIGLGSLFFCWEQFASYRLLLTQKPKSSLSAKIPKEELCFLDYFFQFLFLKENFAYVLFGDKAMGISYYLLPPFSGKMSSDLLRYWNTNVKKGAEIFQKYRHLFPMNNCEMVFFEEEGVINITFINKRNFLKVFQQHQATFQRLLGSQTSGESLLHMLIHDPLAQYSTPYQHNELLGILLGYGNHNARLFERREEIRRYMINFSLSSSPSEGFNSLEEEFNFLNNQLRPVFPYENSLLTFLPLPGFMADTDCFETKKLQKKYREQRKQIMQEFSKNTNFLEMILQNPNW